MVKIGTGARPILTLSAVIMVTVVVLGYMRPFSAPSIVRGFAGPAIFWRAVLLALAMTVPLTRPIHAATRHPSPQQILPETAGANEKDPTSSRQRALRDAGPALLVFKCPNSRISRDKV